MKKYIKLLAISFTCLIGVFLFNTSISADTVDEEYIKIAENAYVLTSSLNEGKEIMNPPITEEQISKGIKIATPIGGLTNTTSTFNWENGGELQGTRVDLSRGSQTAWTFVYYLQLNDKNKTKIFCFEPEFIAGATNTTTKVPQSWSSFSKSEQTLATEYIREGLDLYQSNRNENYLYATQLLVWEALGWKLDYNHTSIKNATNTIKQKYSVRNKIPSFASSSTSNTKTYELNYNFKSKQYETVLTDTNKVIDSLFNTSNFIKTYGDYKISRIGNNKVLISTKNASAKTQTIGSASARIRCNTLCLKEQKYYTGNQDMLSTNSIGVPAYLQVKVKPHGSIDIVKKNQIGQSIQGVEFSLYNRSSGGSLLAKATTDKNGKVKFNNIPYGTYYYNETKVPGNVDINKSRKKIVVNKQSTLVNVANIENGVISINKKNQNGQSIQDVEFSIYNSETATYPLEKATTDKNGIATFKRIPFGSYYYAETKAPSHVQNDTSIRKSIDINKEHTTINVVNQEFGDIYIEEIYSEMNNNKVEVLLSTDDRVPGSSSIKVNVNGVLEDLIVEKDKEYLLDFNIEQGTKDLPLVVTLENGESTQFLFPNNKMKSTRYLASKDSVLLEDKGKIKIDTPIAVLSTWESNKVKDTKYYEGIDFTNFHQDFKVYDDRYPVDQTVSYYRDDNGRYYDNGYAIEGTEVEYNFPMIDESIQFNQVENNYKVPGQINEDRINLKDVYIENQNGRIYQANTEKIDNPTTNQKKLSEGYVDKDDILTKLDNFWLLPLDNELINQKSGNTREEATNTKYTVGFESGTIGENDFKASSKMKYKYISKTYSFYGDKGKNNYSINIGANSIFSNAEKTSLNTDKITSCNMKEAQVQVLTDPAYSKIYIGSNLKEFGACSWSINYSKLNNIKDDYYEDYKESPYAKQGRGKYEDSSFTGLPSVIKENNGN